MMSIPRLAFHRSATFKLLGVGFLALLMAIPLQMLDGLRREREDRRAQAERALAASFGDAQRVGAPLLRVMVETSDQHAEGADRVERSWRYLVPDRVDADAELDIERRRRGIFELPVDLAEVTLTAQFASPRAMLEVTDGVVSWSQAELVFGVSDPRGLREIETTFEEVVGTRPEALGEGPGGVPLFRIGRVDLSRQDAPIHGQLRLSLAGSRRFDWMPLASIAHDCARPGQIQASPARFRQSSRGSIPRAPRQPGGSWSSIARYPRCSWPTRSTGRSLLHRALASACMSRAMSISATSEC